MHAVGADDHVGRRGRPVREPQLGARVALLDADAAAAEVQPFAAEPVGERLQQRDAMDAVVGRAERRLVDAVAAHRMVGDDLAGDPVPDDQRRGHDRDGLDLLAEPEPPQLARAVGRQRDGGADLAQLVGLLVDLEPIPRSRSASARTSPPIPPPTTATFSPAIGLGDRRRARRAPARSRS